jgi:hypothetical protein
MATYTKISSRVCEQMSIDAKVETCVAGGLEVEGLPGYLQMLICQNKRDKVLTK